MTGMRTAAAVLALLLSLTARAAVVRFGVVMTEELGNPHNPSLSGAVATVTVDDLASTLRLELFARTGNTVTDVRLLERGATVADFTSHVNGRRIDATVPIDTALAQRLISDQRGDFQLTAAISGAFRNPIGTLTRLDATQMWAGELGTAGAFVVTLDYTNRLTVNVAGIAGQSLLRAPDGSVVANIPSAFTTTLSAERAAELRARPHDFSIAAGELRGNLARAFEYDMAVAGKVGAWKTDVRIFNRSFDADVTVLIEYFDAAPYANIHPQASLALRIPKRSTAILDDVSSHLGIEGTGALRITSISPLVATSRIANDRRVGQFVPAIARENTMRHGVLTQLAYRLPSKARTNIGIFNPNDTEVQVRLAAHRPVAHGGSPFYTKSLTVGPRSQQQRAITQYFMTEQINGDDLTVTFDASAPLIVYASVIDLVSLDPIFVPPQPD